MRMIHFSRLSGVPTFSTRALCVMALAGGLLFAGCGDDDTSSASSSSNMTNTTGGGGGGGGGGGNGTKKTGEAGCDDASECAGNVCVAVVDSLKKPPVYCTETCTEGSCPEGFVCDSELFGLVGLSFCRFAPPMSSPMKKPPAPEEPPKLPCKTDAECAGEQICATYKGERGCTIPCEMEEQCTPPKVGGISVSIDALTCTDDEGDTTRKACLPDPKCYDVSNPGACISGFPGL